MFPLYTYLAGIRIIIIITIALYHPPTRLVFLYITYFSCFSQTFPLIFLRSWRIEGSYEASFHALCQRFLSVFTILCIIAKIEYNKKKNTVDSTQEGVQKHRKCFVLFYCKACIPTKQTQKVNLEFNLCKINQSYLVAYSQYGDDATYTFHHTALQI